jgi:hypothetical protein
MSNEEYAKEIYNNNYKSNKIKQMKNTHNVDFRLTTSIITYHRRSSAVQAC